MIEELETDTEYLASPNVSHFDSSPWTITTNKFERRMALNLKVGTVLCVTPEILERVLGSSARICNQTVTVDLEYLAGAQAGLVSATIEGLFSHFLIPASAGHPANFQLALRETAQKRERFMASLTPDSRFWIHSEFAAPAGEADWTSTLDSTSRNLLF